ncbi:MAG TPA: alpha/beta hydrolase [Dermatophilaceae bacterium]|nr:alpha/beta hydrolase [Dermatophilaceae bacterium]
MAHRPGRRAAAVLVCAAANVLGGCGPTSGSGGPASGGASAGQGGRPSAGPTSHEYGPGLPAFPHLPRGVDTAPVVVMVPGGSWETADPSGLEPLAAALATAGIVAIPVVVRAASDGVVYPVPVEDVLCALADGAVTARAAGITPGPLVLLGHSSGAHLAALATLTADRVSPPCADPVVRPDALIGLAGPYDLREVADAAEPLFGEPPDEAPVEWDAANPVLLAGARPQVPVLLLHGEDDDTVPTSLSTDFAAALRRGGHETTLRLLPGEDHAGLYSAEAVAAPVAAWVKALPGAARSAGPAAASRRGPGTRTPRPAAPS